MASELSKFIEDQLREAEEGGKGGESLRLLESGSKPKPKLGALRIGKQPSPDGKNRSPQRSAYGGPASPGPVSAPQPARSSWRWVAGIVFTLALLALLLWAFHRERGGRLADFSRPSPPTPAGSLSQPLVESTVVSDVASPVEPDSSSEQKPSWRAEALPATAGSTQDPPGLSSSTVPGAAHLHQGAHLHGQRSGMPYGGDQKRKDNPDEPDPFAAGAGVLGAASAVLPAPVPAPAPAPAPCSGAPCSLPALLAAEAPGPRLAAEGPLASQAPAPADTRGARLLPAAARYLVL